MRVLGLIFGLAAAFLPEAALAQEVNPCPFDFLPCGGGGIAGASEYVTSNFFPALRVAFIALALAHFFYYGFKMMYEGNDDEATRIAKGGYEQAIYGCGIMSLATFFVEAFGEDARDTLINPEPLTEGVTNIITYMKTAVAMLVTVMIVTVSFRLVVVQDEGERDKAKKRLFAGFFGVAAILLANALVEAIFPGTSSAGLGAEATGIANFLITIFGALAVFWFIAAGLYLLLNVGGEAGGDNAKKAFKASIMAIAVVITSYILLNFFLTL